MTIFGRTELRKGQYGVVFHGEDHGDVQKCAALSNQHVSSNFADSYRFLRRFLHFCDFCFLAHF